MNLRGHHLLCIFGWKGYGHGESFNRAMDEVVATLQLKKRDVSDGVRSRVGSPKMQRTDPLDQTPNRPRIIVSARPDQICKRCENIGLKGCFKDERDQEEEIQAHDKRILAFLGLTVGDQISVKQLKSLIKEKKPYERLSYLCEGCPWLEKDYCYEGLKSIDN